MFLLEETRAPGQSSTEVKSMPQRTVPEKPVESVASQDITPPFVKVSGKVPAKAAQQVRTLAKMNPASSEQEPTEGPKVDTVLHISNQSKDVHILAGHAQVLNPVTKELEAVHVMLDTGANRSFISKELADKLRLQNVESLRLRISTFGSQIQTPQTPLVKVCGVTVLQMWVARGTPHSFTVTRIDAVTETIQRNSLSLQDKRFLCDNDLQLSLRPASTNIHPQILLGWADLVLLLDNGLALQYILPSGQLIPSKLGYLVAGRRNDSGGAAKEHQEAVIHTASSIIVDDNSQSWEDFCAFESSGVDEFAGPKTEERKRTDNAVCKTFEETIRRKEDGYWVRFPWRKDAQVLPDNKPVAVRRLQALMTRLKSEPETLQKYVKRYKNSSVK
ncbi:Tas retrotransposon peptidase A16 [Necator americanus]|uniref:Tas retrotransposon peptidase A16 n=1 Tax=Necator americanus TaxID=51031 RepID=W2T5M8_NECAM|nr:Tas retrotransposon peptidase A16 [Necator americanus]ETN76252.1 Tas retrotransposon peptidase A16 [Necator americanus]